MAFGSALFTIGAAIISFSPGGLLSLIITGIVSFVLLPTFPRHRVAYLLPAPLGLRVGIPRLLRCVAFWGSAMLALYPPPRSRTNVDDPWLTYSAQLAISSLMGFSLSAHPLQRKA